MHLKTAPSQWEIFAVMLEQRMNKVMRASGIVELSM